MATIHHCRDYEEMSLRAAARVTAAATAKSDFLLCAPTGNSPAGLYQELIREGARQPDLLRNFRIVKLDEWLGVLPDDPVSCEHYLQSRLVGPLAITAERYLSFDSQTKDPCGNAPGSARSSSARARSMCAFLALAETATWL